jgi:signal peptidase I
MKAGGIRSFFNPTLSRGVILRMALVAAAALLIFNFVLIPFRISGRSMEPTYLDGGFNFCNTLAYAFSGPKRGDVVVIRMAGDSVMLLKRVVGLSGDSISFEKGMLLVDAHPLDEPYVGLKRNWNLPPRRVKPGHVYVVGDNRDVPMMAHRFGQTPVNRIAGAPLW